VPSTAVCAVGTSLCLLCPQGTKCQHTPSSLCTPLSSPAGLSLKSQELTAAFLAVRLYCSLVMEKDIHTVLDLLTLIATGWVIYTIRYQLWSSYSEEMDNLPNYYVVRLRGALRVGVLQ